MAEAQQIEEVEPDIKCDVVLKPSSKNEDSMVMVNELRAKGYCSVDLNLDDDVLDNIFREVKTISSDGAFSELPEEIADGLLGLDGSERFADLPSEDLPTGIQRCDDALTELVELISWYTPALDIVTRSRTKSVILEAGKKRFGKTPPSLDEDHIIKWRSTFEVGKLMLLMFMGPGSGTLTLTPRDDVDAKPLEVPTAPGMVVILRSDLLASRHTVKGRKAYVLTSFLVQEGSTGSMANPAYASASKSATAEKLDEWTKEKLKELTIVDVDDLEAHVEKNFKNPAWWRAAYDHMYHSVQQTAIRGLGVRCPSTWKQEAIFPACVAGMDGISDVPFTRWALEDYYDPEPDCWMRGKINVKHGGFAEGLEMFDTKFFKIAPGEAKGSDPQQRIILEVGYESLYQAGRRSKNLLNSLTGVYVASQMSEFPMIDAGDSEGGGCEQRAAGTGIAGAIMSNRFSFVMGMQGPSVMVDTDASSSLTCLQLAAQSLFAGKVMSTMATSISSSIMMTPLTWMGRIATGEMTSSGRAFSWDARADGWVRGDGFASICIDNYLDLVDGELVQDASRPAVGVISGTVVRGVGAVATLNSPSAAATQVLFYETARQSGVALTSVDAVDCHADSQLLHDAVEMQMVRKCFAGGMKQGGYEGRAPVACSSTKGNYGNSIQSAGATSIIKRLYEQRVGMSTSMQHLRQLSPYLLQDADEADEQPTLLQTEHIMHPGNTSIIAVPCFGFGGTIACTTLTGHTLSAESPPEKTEKLVQSLPWWPAGGGKLEDGAVPAAGYDIIGSWSSWSTKERFEDKGNGICEYVVSLGVNGFEQFRILIDGDEGKVLHPGCTHGESGMPVYGPAAEDESGFWTVQGSSASDSIEEAASSIGDQYCITHQTTGKYRRITWERIVHEKASIQLLL
jgi:polyketide synthase-associated protein